MGVEDKKYSSFPEWQTDKTELKKENSLANLPYVKNHDTGDVVTQSSACYLYLGRQLGLTPSGTADKQEQIIAETFDLRNGVIDIVYPFGKVKTPEAYKETLPGHMEKKVKVHYEKIEGALKESFFCGSSMSTCDFHVWEMIDQHEMMAKKAGLTSPVKAFPKLEALYKRVRAL